MSPLDLLRSTERETLKFRLVALLVVSATVFVQGVDEAPFLTVVALISGYLLYSLFLRTVLIPRFTSYPLLGAMLVVDAATLLAAINLIGLSSPVIMLLPISVVYYGLYQGYVGSLTMAVIVSFGFVGLVSFQGRLEEMANVVAVQVPSSFLLALLVGYLAQARLKESEERRVYQQLVQAETHGRRLLEIAQTIGDDAWRGLGPQDIVTVAAEMSGLPSVGLIRADSVESGNDRVRLLAATFSARSTDSVRGQDFAQWSEAMAASGEFERQGPGSSAGLVPDAWLPEKDTHGYLWAVQLARQPLTALYVLGDPDAGPVDEIGKRAVRSFAGLATRLLDVQELRATVEQRSKDVLGNLRASVESTERLSHSQNRRPLRFNRVNIEPQRERIRLGTQTVNLSKTEFDLLYILASNAGGIYNTETLLREVWGPDYVPQGKPVDVAIHRLRRKLNAIPNGSKLVQTVRGRGYTFAETVAASIDAEPRTAVGA